jgi:hypothetical protein
MQYFLIFFLQLTLYAQNYNFDEVKFISAVSTEFKKSGNITIEKNKVTITYNKPIYKQIIKDKENISIKGSSGKIYTLKGKAKYYTKQFIDNMIILGDFNKIKTNRDFDIKKEKDVFFITFLGDVSNQISKAEVITKNSKVISFKMFLPNKDTLKILKK